MLSSSEYQKQKCLLDSGIPVCHLHSNEGNLKLCLAVQQGATVDTVGDSVGVTLALEVQWAVQ